MQARGSLFFDVFLEVGCCHKLLLELLRYRVLPLQNEKRVATRLVRGGLHSLAYGVVGRASILSVAVTASMTRAKFSLFRTLMLKLYAKIEQLKIIQLQIERTSLTTTPILHILWMILFLRTNTRKSRYNGKKWLVKYACGCGGINTTIKWDSGDGLPQIPPQGQRSDLHSQEKRGRREQPIHPVQVADIETSDPEGNTGDERVFRARPEGTVR